ncbi:helix-turn-helix domain-containing protein [Agrobacterium tumefaciens]|uniref:helix-turn-helix domain-containing protein n=1 Tax=Agrobacterium tumefaciens TaxID=358 RepID=UPI00396A79EE
MRPPPRILAAARLLLGQSQTEVSKDSGISRKTIHMAESGTAGIASVEKLMRYYTAHGITFIGRDNEAGWGIRTKFLDFDYGQ